jgi:hypothetical protein
VLRHDGRQAIDLDVSQSGPYRSRDGRGPPWSPGASSSRFGSQRRRRESTTTRSPSKSNELLTSSTESQLWSDYEWIAVVDVVTFSRLPVEVFARNAGDADAAIDVLATILKLERGRLTFKPRAGWDGWTDYGLRSS